MKSWTYVHEVSNLRIKVHTRRHYGAKQAAPVRVATTLRVPADTLERWRASGKGWQTHAAELLKAHAPL